MVSLCSNSLRQNVRRGWLFLFFSFLVLIATSCESQKTIVNGLEEREANEILVFLSNKNIDAQKVKAAEAGGGGAKVTLWNIVVDSGKATDAMAYLNAAGLPRRRGQQLLELFTAGGLVPSEIQQKIRYQAGLAEQIASSIRKIDGIIDADVTLSFPEEDPLNPQAQKGKITASVYVKHTGVLDDPNSHLVTKIRRLVASSVAGLDFENVTVIGDLARFSDASIAQAKLASTAGIEYVKVWSLILARDSLTRFQILFFSLTLIILLFGLSLFWVFWKFYPLLKKRGGIKALFHFAPIKDEIAQPEVKAEEKPKDNGNTPKPEAEGPKVQENVENV